MQDTTLLILTDNGYESVDIFAELPISVNYAELSISEIDSRLSPYSQTFTIPGTQNNNELFEHFYEINGTDFNPLNDVKCVVQYRGLDIFRGFLRLNKVIRYYDYNEFEVYITSEVNSLASVLKDTTLQDLNWAPYEFDMNYTSITTSWSANTVTNDGLFNGDILMPLINYGLIIQSGFTEPDFKFTMDDDRIGESITFSGNAIPTTYFKPAIRLKAVVDTIFSGTGFNYNSEFFETDYFRSIYMDTAQNGELGPVLPSGNTNENFFKVYGPRQVAFLPVATGVASYQGLQQTFPFVGFESDGFDGLGNFTFYDLNTQQGGYFQAPYTGNYFWNIRFSYKQYYAKAAPTYFRVTIRTANDPANLSTGTILYTTSGLGLPALQGFQNSNLFFSGSVIGGEYIKPFIEIETNGEPTGGVYIIGYQGAVINDVAPYWDLYGSPFFTSQTTINMKFQMPDITCISFMKGLINTFNLVVTQDEQENTFKIEPLPWYLNENQRTERDWTEYIDINSAVEIQALNFDLPKQINWKGDYNDNETLNRLYLDQYQLMFGERRFLTQFTIPEGEKEITTPFAPLPTDFISGSTNVIIPQLWYLDGDKTNTQTVNFQSARQRSPHLFFWVGNRYFFKDYGNYDVSNRRNWWLYSGNTPVAQTTYPCVNHISNLDSLDASQVSDLNFFPSTDYYFDVTSPFIKYVQNTVYRYFWETHIDNLYSPEARKLTAKFLMSPQYYSDLKLTDKIWIKDASYRIDRISGANLVEPESTEITLVKDIELYYKDTLWAPSVGIAPNAPYPPAPPCVVYPVTVVFNFDAFLVCNEDVPALPFYSTDPNGLVNGAFIYTTSGCTNPVPTGLYLRETGSTENFVIDTFGRAQSNGNC